MWCLFVFEAALYAAVAPLLPHYVDQYGLTKAGAGLLAATYSAGFIPGAFLGGWLAVRVGVRRTAVMGMVALGLSTAAFGFGSTVAALDIARTVQGAAAGVIWSGALTWLIVAAPAGRRGQVIGSALGAAIFGTLLGPVIGTLAVHEGERLVFTAVAVAAATLALAVLRLRDPGRAGTEGGIGWRALGDAWLRTATWVFTLSAMAVGALVALVPLRLDGLGASSTTIGLTFVIASGVAALVSPAAGRWSDRHGRLLPVRVGLVLLAALLVILPAPHSALLVAALAVAILGVSVSVLQTPASALVTDAAERAGMSLASACMLVNVTFALGETLGAPIGSALAQATSDALPFSLLAAMLLATLGVLRWPGPPTEVSKSVVPKSPSSDGPPDVTRPAGDDLV